MRKALSLLGTAHFPGGHWGWQGLMLVTSPRGAWLEGHGFAQSRTVGLPWLFFLCFPCPECLLSSKAFTPGNYSDEAGGYLKTVNGGFWGNVFKG